MSLVPSLAQIGNLQCCKIPQRLCPKCRFLGSSGLITSSHVVLTSSPHCTCPFHCRFTKTLDIHDSSNNLGFADNGTTPVNVLRP